MNYTAYGAAANHLRTSGYGSAPAATPDATNEQSPTCPKRRRRTSTTPWKAMAPPSPPAAAAGAKPQPVAPCATLTASHLAILGQCVCGHACRHRHRVSRYGTVCFS